MAALTRSRFTLSMLLLAATQCAWAAGQVTEAHAGTRKGAVYEATPQPYAPAMNAGGAATSGATNNSGTAPAVSNADGGSAPVEPGAGVEIISGGGSTAGAARVGHLPVLQ